jgi:hypothetical protein
MEFFFFFLLINVYSVAMQHPWILKYAHESHRHMEDDFECSGTNKCFFFFFFNKKYPFYIDIEFRLPKAPSDPGTPRMESSCMF